MEMYETTVIAIILSYVCYNWYMLWRGAHSDEYREHD